MTFVNLGRSASLVSSVELISAWRENGGGDANRRGSISKLLLGSLANCFGRGRDGSCSKGTRLELRHYFSRRPHCTGWNFRLRITSTMIVLRLVVGGDEIFEGSNRKGTEMAMARRRRGLGWRVVDECGDM